MNFLDDVDVNNSFMLAGVDHPLLYQHLIACTAQTCRMHMLHIRERLSVPIICPLQTKISSCNTGLPLEMTWKPSSICLQSFGTKWIGDAISWAQAVERRIPKWWTVASTENWIPTLVHMEVPKLQLPHFLTALFSHSEPRLPPWIVQKMACEDAGQSEVGASIVLTDSCIGNKMVMRRHVRNS